MFNNYIDNFARICLGCGGRLNIMDAPEIRTSQFPSICNSTIYNDNGRLLTNLRLVNFIQCFENNPSNNGCYYGSLCYMTRDDDNTLRTLNYLAELDDNLNTINVHKLGFNENPNPKYEMIGLEDVRLVRWDDILWIVGCNRDTFESGYCNMVMVEIDEETGAEKRRVVIQNVSDYIEKNWVPIIDKPYHFMRWANPLEIYKVDIETGIPELVINKSYDIPVDYDGHLLRGSSQVIPWKDYYISIIHVTELYTSKRGDKCGRYLHQFLVWDKEFNFVKCSPLFNFAGNVSEFCVGLCMKDDQFYIPFSTGDSTQYVIRVGEDVIEKFINQEFIEYVPSDEFNVHETCISNPTPFYLEMHATHMYEQGYWAAAYFLFCKVYRRKRSYKDYVYKCLQGLSLAKSDGRYLCELYEFQSAVMDEPQFPEAYYFISNYYHWRGYPELSAMYAQLAFERIGNSNTEVKELLCNDISDDLIRFHYFRSLWFTPRFEESKDLLLELRENCDEYIKTLIDNELARQFDQERKAQEMNRYFGR